jgi:hypothetical protein
LFVFFSIEINQKVQNSTVGASKVHSNNDQTGVERSNSLSGRKYLHVQIYDYFICLGTRSRGSITMRMLMGANDIYADGKVQLTPANGWEGNFFLYFEYLFFYFLFE